MQRIHHSKSDKRLTLCGKQKQSTPRGAFYKNIVGRQATKPIQGKRVARIIPYQTKNSAPTADCQYQRGTLFSIYLTILFPAAAFVIGTIAVFLLFIGRYSLTLTGAFSAFIKFRIKRVEILTVKIICRYS